ncbi:MAG: molybdopterin molybdotransferase MoeA [Deltaproteobacteria bacterium]|nr:molybdopterin molybdotransferase MoeA [Deltaproteobacteria bacterium]
MRFSRLDCRRRWSDDQGVVSVGEAVEMILKEVSPLPAEEVRLLDACGRVLSEDVRAPRSVPPFPNSAMDGYAVRWKDVADTSVDHPVTLRVVEEVPAGYVPKARVTENSAIKIMTGAPMPRGADTVVRVEYTRSLPGEVRITRVDGPGSHIREAGEDIRKGQTILEKGKLLTPADVGLMASVGKGRVRVYRRPTVALFSTGDELQEVDERPKAGKIVNSNSYTLSAWIRQTGAIPLRFGIVRDKRRSLAAAFRKALRYDAVMTTGGVSVGDYDFVKEALGDAGVQMQFWKVAQKPGHPLAFGRIGKKPVFGLPGNPVSSAVSFLLYARPALLKMMGYRNLFLPVTQARLEHPIKTSAGVTEFIRCRIRRQDGQNFASSTGTQGSGVLRSMSIAQGLIVAHENETHLEEGAEVTVIVLNPQDFLQPEMGF